MKKSLFYFSIIILSLSYVGCKAFGVASPRIQAQSEKIRKCRAHWTYESFQGIKEIKLLFHDRKRLEDLSAWANFFIGITMEGDTIGLIDYHAEGIFKKGKVLKFRGREKLNATHELTDSISNEPAFTVHKKSRVNNWYCAVKTIYYSELIQQ